MSAPPITSSTTTTTTYRISKVIVLQPGEQFILPPGAVVVAASGEVVSSCNDNIPVEELKCYHIQWEIEGNNARALSSHIEDAWEGGHLDKITIGNTEYIIDYNAYWSDGPTGVHGLETLLNRVPTMNTAVFTTDPDGYSMAFIIEFQSIPSIANNISLYMHSDRNTHVIIKPRLCS